MSDGNLPGVEAPSLSYRVARSFLAADELARFLEFVRLTIRSQVDSSYYGVSAPLFSELTARFGASVERIAALLESIYGFRFALCNAMFYENSFYSDSYIPAHVDLVNDFPSSTEFEHDRSIQVWFPLAQSEHNGMHLAPREKNGFYAELDAAPDPYEVFAVDNRTFFRSRYSSEILFEWRQPILFDTPALEPGDLLCFSQKTLHFTEKIKTVGGYRVAVALRYLDRAFEIKPFTPKFERLLAINDFQFQSGASPRPAPPSRYLGEESRG